MKHTAKAATRIFSMLLAVTLILAALPVSAFSGIDEPLSGATGDGWDNLSGDFSNFASSSYSDSVTEKDGEYDDGFLSAEELNSVDDSESYDADTMIESQITSNMATSGTTLGQSSENPMAWYEEYQAWAISLAEAQNNGQMRASASPIIIFYTWGSSQVSDRVVFANGAYINSPLPMPTLAGKTSFCIEWNGLTPAGSYTSVEGYDPGSRVAQIIANYENSSKSRNDYAAAQIGIWASIMGTSVSSWGTCPAASSANTILNGGSDYSGYQFTLWKGGPQDLISWDNDVNPDGLQLIILKKNEDGSKVVSNATFNVTGPGGFNFTGKTNSQGKIVISAGLIPGEYTVTETTPPAGYELSDTSTQKVTLSESNKTATVEFLNKRIVGSPEEEGSSYHIEVRTEVSTETEVRQQTSYQYSDAIGQLTIRKHDQDGKSLDGALFNIDVAFTNGSHVRADNWEVDNGARLFTWTHPMDNHDPATVTITEVQPPRYYTGDPTPKTVVVNPTYTRVTHVETWTVTITTENTSSTVIEIDSGEVVDVSSSSSTAEVTSNPQVQEYADFVEGDRETTVTFVNQRNTGDIEVIKKDANTGQPLAGAQVHLWGEDLGDPNHIDRTIVTDANGVAYFDNLPPGTYAIQETQPPFGYTLNNEIQNGVLQSGQIIRKEIRNYRKDGLIIKKVDQDGKALAGAVFELRRGSGEVLLREVTNANGIIFRDYLADDTYVIEEISAPEGYMLDENPIQSIRIYGTDDNKEYTVTFVNKKKPAIEITKVDGTTPTLKLEGATFRVTNSRTGQYWDITTGEDGKALLENLEVNTTYIVEEQSAPEGYVNSGYRQEIVLREARIHTLTISNEQKPTLKIIKKDKASGALLGDATFRISWNSGADYRDVTTKADGSANISDLNVGWYTIVETRSPQGYLLDNTPHQILLEEGKTAVIELFNEAKPSLTIMKVDNVTKTPLQYAKFKIEKKTDTGTTLIGEYVSDENGLIHLEDIDPGRYEVTEIQAPDGYVIDTSTREVTIEFGLEYKIEFTNTPQSPIYIQKVDDKGTPLAGAEFKVTTMNGAMVGTVKTGSTGYAIIPYVEPGWYVVQEVKAPDGYILSSTPVNIEVKSGRPAQVEFVNYQKPVLQILKLDRDTQKALVGARFKITEASGALVGEHTSDINGLITIEGLDSGNYIITEIRSPDGYILDMTPQVVTLNAGKTLRVEFFNTAKPGLQLQKLDKLTGLPIKGTMFSVVELQNSAKKDHGVFTTSENGTFFIPDLTPGNYIITEVKSADGYILDSTPKNIYVEGGKLNTVEFYNTPYSDLRILKIDSETREPLTGAVFKLFDEKRLEIGTYTTSALGEIYVTGLSSGTYFVQEQKAPAGYLLDNTVRQVELLGGKTTTVEWKNTQLGSLRILKIDADTKKPLYGATFLIYDSKDNLLGEYITDQSGLITFGRNLQAGKYKIKEVKAPDNYVLDETVHTVTVKDGATSEVTIKNELQVGNIQIIKVSDGKNSITKDKQGDGLKGAIFEIYDERLNLVDKIETDHNGFATSKYLPLGKYAIKEVKSPKYYFTDGKPFYAEIKVHGDLIRFRVENTPEEIEVSVEKRGVVETMAGETIRYDFSDIANKSNCSLDNFYWKDELPTDAVRIQSLTTGIWSEKTIYEVWIKTNLKDWKRIKSNMHTTSEYTIDMRPSALGLASNEYVTQFKLEFGTVEAGFHATKNPFIAVRVNNGLPMGYRFTNRTDVGGKRGDEWEYDRDSWITVIYRVNRKLPKTGY